MAEDQQEKGKGKGNPVFGQNILGKFLELRTEWDKVVNDHPKDTETINQQTSKDANEKLASGANGPIAAINAVIEKIDGLGIENSAANRAKEMLQKLRTAVLEQREQESRDAAEKKKGGSTAGKQEKIQWTLPTPESPEVKSLEEFLNDMPRTARQHRQQQINALSAAGRTEIDMLLAKGTTKKELGQTLSRLSH